MRDAVTQAACYALGAVIMLVVYATEWWEES
jgi:hypothetical protein